MHGVVSVGEGEHSEEASRDECSAHVVPSPDSCQGGALPADDSAPATRESDSHVLPPQRTAAAGSAASAQMQPCTKRGFSFAKLHSVHSRVACKERGGGHESMSESRDTDIAIARGPTELVADIQEAPPPLPQRGSSLPPPLPPQALAAVPEPQALLEAVPDPKSEVDSPQGDSSRSDSSRGVRGNTLPKVDSPQGESSRGVRGNTLAGVLAARRCASVWRKTATHSPDVNTTRPMTTAKEAKYFKGIAFQQQTVIESPHGAEVVTNLQDLAHLAPARPRAVTRTSGTLDAEQSSCDAEPEPLERTSASCEDIDRLHKLMAVTRAQDRVNRRRVHTILPYGRRKVWWDRLILTCVFYSAISVPFIAGILTRQNVPMAVRVVQYLIDAVFLVDVLVNAHTAFVSARGNLVTSLPEVRRRYLRSYLALDVLAALPWDILCLEPSVPVQLWRTALSLRLLRLTKLWRWYNDYVMRFGHVGADHLRRVAFLVLGLLLTTHLLGCGLTRLDGFGDQFEGLRDPSLPQPHAGELYVYSIYCAMQLIFGEARVATRNPATRDPPTTPPRHHATTPPATRSSQATPPPVT